MATLTGGLLPATSGIPLNSRGKLLTPQIHTVTTMRASADAVLQRQGRRNSQQASVPSRDCHSASSMVANPKLSVIEVEAFLRQKVRNQSLQLQQAFQNYDTETTLSVTKGEFRRVLESFCLPVTTEQFNMIVNKIDTNPNGTVKYNDFLEKFGAPSAAMWRSGTQRCKQIWINPAKFRMPLYISTHTPNKENLVDNTEKQLREKVQQNMKEVIKGLRLYDYNRDGYIQKKELRNVLENYCFKMTDQQFDKFYYRYDFQRKGVLNYKEFLRQLGINVDRQLQGPAPANSAQNVMKWQDVQQQYHEHGGKRVLQRPNMSQLDGLSWHQIESQFRAKMKENYADIKRMFLAFDKQLDGFISIESLQSVLAHFTIPMTDHLFIQLMDRLGVKASGKVSWEMFLERFQDPQSAGNGQTITIKANHKFFPIRGVDESLGMRDVLELLREHVCNGYASFKHAFLQLNKNHDGKISRKDLQELFDNFKFRISDRQFKDLMTLLDPQHTNFFSYHKFLDLFEDRETKEGHKWLKSDHRFNEKTKPAILAWDTVEKLLRDKMEERWKEVSSALMTADKGGTSMIAINEMRKILETYGLPVSNDHFENMVNSMTERTEGQLNYREFLVKLGVTIKPGDLIGVSSQIQDGSNDAQNRMQADISKRQLELDFSIQDRTSMMTAEEIIVRLKDRMAQHNNKIRDAFNRYDVKRTGKVTKKNFRLLIENYGLYTSDAQFKDLCTHLSFHKGHMTYADFVKNFEDQRQTGGPGEQLQKTNNHRVNSIRGDRTDMTAKELENRLRSKLRENFENLRGAFYKFDTDHNGELTKDNFRRMLDSFLCGHSDEAFEALCKKLKLTNKSKISYRQFLQRFEIVDTAEGHKWLNSDHKYNKQKPTKSLLAAQVHEILVRKAHEKYHDLAKTFCKIDLSGSGCIRKNGLREMLFTFVLPVNKTEFNKLWDKYDHDHKGFINHAEFLRTLAGEQFAPGDDHGPSRRIMDDSYKTVEIRALEQEEKHNKMSENQSNRTANMSTHQIVEMLGGLMRDVYEDLHAAFSKYDSRRRGYLVATDFQKMLFEFNILLNDDQMFDLIERLNLSHSQGKMTLDDFRVAFEKGRKDQYEPKPKDVTYPPNSYSKLSPVEAEEKIRSIISEQTEVLENAFKSFDPDYTGQIVAANFRSILDQFCFKLSDAQFKHLASQYSPQGKGLIEYVGFIDSFQDPNTETDPRCYSSLMTENMRSETPQIMSSTEIQETVKEYVKAKYTTLAKSLTDADYARIGVISKDDFKSIVNKNVMRITDEQFDRFWLSLGVNDFGNLDYHQFLKEYSTTGDNGAQILRLSHSSHGRGRPHTSDTVRSGSAMGGPARPFTPMVNAESIESKVKDLICKHWKEIQKLCKAADHDNCGQVSAHQITNVLSKFNANLSEDETRKLLLKYDLNNNNQFCYPEFLKHFVLNKPSKDDKGHLLTRKKIQPSRFMNSPGEKSELFESAMNRIHKSVTQTWKDMRRQFRMIDQSGSGLISPDDFRQVLRNLQVNLSEDEFYHITCYFDKELKGSMAYNQFLRSFLTS